MYYFWVTGRSPSDTQSCRICGLLKWQDGTYQAEDREQTMNRQAPSVNIHHSADAKAWYLLAEFSANEFLSDDGRSAGLMAGFLPQRIQELDTLPEWAAILEAMLARFAREVREHFGQGGRVRVFCQRQIIDEGYSERVAPQPDAAGQRLHRAQAILGPGKKMKGGWGYYAIEKGSDSTGAACQESCHTIEIYVYRESMDKP